MKKLLWIMVVCSLFCLAMPSAQASLGVRSGDYSYSLLDDGTACVMRYYGEAAELEIPAVLDGHTVSKIGEFAFFCNTQITSVVFPESITVIDSAAFASCSSLVSVLLPSRLLELNKRAFSLCLSLESVQFPQTLTCIGEDAFLFCESLKSLDLPSGLISIGDRAFRHCKALTDVSIPASVTDMGAGVFEGCRSIEVSAPAESYAAQYCAQNQISLAGIAADDQQHFTLEDFSISAPGDYAVTTGTRGDMLVFSAQPTAMDAPFGLLQIIWSDDMEEGIDFADPAFASNDLATAQMLMMSAFEGQIKASMGVSDVKTEWVKLIAFDGVPALASRYSYVLDYYTVGWELCMEINSVHMLVTAPQGGYYTVQLIAAGSQALDHMLSDCMNTLRWNHSDLKVENMVEIDVLEQLYQEAEQACGQKHYQQAYELYMPLCMFDAYRDSDTKLQQCADLLGRTVEEVPLFSEGMDLYEQGRYAEAETCFRISSLFRNSGEAQQMRRKCLEQLGR